MNQINQIMCLNNDPFEYLQSNLSRYSSLGAKSLMNYVEQKELLKMLFLI